MSQPEATRLNKSGDAPGECETLATTFFFLFRRFYRRIHRRIEPRHDSPGFSSNLIAILRRLIESTTTKSLFAHLSNIGVRFQVEFP